MSAFFNLSDFLRRTFLYKIDLQSEQNIFVSDIHMLSLYIGYKLCTHQCECVGTKISSSTEEQVSRNFFGEGDENVKNLQTDGQ